jgi:hypothetical protein
MHHPPQPLPFQALIQAVTANDTASDARSYGHKPRFASGAPIELIGITGDDINVGYVDA